MPHPISPLDAIPMKRGRVGHVIATILACSALSTLSVASAAYAGFVLAIDREYAQDLLLLDMSADGSVFAGEVNSPSGRNGAIWTPLGGAQIFDLAPGENDSFRSISADGSRLLTHAPGAAPSAPYGQIWSEGVGVVASAPSMAPDPEPVGMFMSSDGTTLIMKQTVPGTGGDPDVDWVWRWSAASGYTQIGVGTPLAVSGDGATVLLDAELSPGVFGPARWTASSGIVAVPGLGGLANPGFKDMSGDGQVIVGGEDTPSDFDPAIVLTEAAGLGIVGAPDDGGIPTFSRFERVTPDGLTAVGMYRSLFPPAYDQLVQPMTWSATDGFTIVHDELRRQGIDFQGIETIFIMAVSDDGKRFTAVGYSPTLGVPSYTLIYDLDPDHPPTEGTNVPVGVNSSFELLAWPFATGGISIGFDDVSTAGDLVATYRSLPFDESSGVLPDAEDLLALIGDRPLVTSWTLEFDGAVAPASQVGVFLEVPKQLKDAIQVEGALQMLVHDGTSWQPHPWTTPYGRITASFDDVPTAIVVVPAQAPVPLGALVAPGLVGSLAVIGAFRLSRRPGLGT